MIAIWALPSLITMLVGWTAWYEGPHQSGVLPKFSLIGMSLTTVTFFGLCAFAIYAEVWGVILSVHYGLLVGIYKLLAPPCVLGLAFGLIGVWRPNPLRWYAPACALFTAGLWLVGAVMIDPI